VRVIFSVRRVGGFLGTLGRKHDSGTTLVSVTGVMASDTGLTTAAAGFTAVISADVAEVRGVGANLRSLLA
jgi:hypothetical protein